MDMKFVACETARMFGGPDGYDTPADAIKRATQLSQETNKPYSVAVVATLPVGVNKATFAKHKIKGAAIMEARDDSVDGRSPSFTTKKVFETKAEADAAVFRPFITKEVEISPAQELQKLAQHLTPEMRFVMDQMEPYELVMRLKEMGV